MTCLLSDLCFAAIDEQLDPVDVARVSGREERDGLGDLLGMAQATHRRHLCERFEQPGLVLRRNEPRQARRRDPSGADHVDANAAAPEIEYPGPCEVEH